MRIPTIVLSVLAFAATTSHAPADVLTFQYTGIVTDIFSNDNNILGPLQVGDTFSGTFSYDTSVPDATPDDDVTGIYNQITTVTLDVADISLIYHGNVFISVVNGLTSDHFTYGPEGQYGDYDFHNMGMQLMDSTATVFDSNALPTSLDIADFDSRLFILSGTHLPTFDDFTFFGEVTSITIIPAPGAAILFGFALASITPRRRRGT